MLDLALVCVGGVFVLYCIVCCGVYLKRCVAVRYSDNISRRCMSVLWFPVPLRNKCNKGLWLLVLMLRLLRSLSIRASLAAPCVGQKKKKCDVDSLPRWHRSHKAEGLKL